MQKKIIYIFLLILSNILWSQDTDPEYISDSLNYNSDSIQPTINPYKSKVNSKLAKQKNDTLDSLKIFVPRSSEKAALYSAVIPGLGQIYNKKYWKAGLYVGMLGVGIGFTKQYQDLYKEYRSAYLNKLVDDTYLYKNRDVSAETLANNMNRQKRFRDYGIAACVLIYAIQIIDAAVDAHLDPLRKDPDLKLDPVIIQNEVEDAFGYKYNPGLQLSIRF